MTATSKGNKLDVTTQKAASNDNAAVPFDTLYQAYAYYGGLTQTMKDKVKGKEAFIEFNPLVRSY